MRPKAVIFSISIARLRRSLSSSPRTTHTPLSIGVFRAWGSGKSFFMRRVRERVAHLGEIGDDLAGNSPYYDRIAQTSSTTLRARAQMRVQLQHRSPLRSGIQPLTLSAAQSHPSCQQLAWGPHGQPRE
jgi:hypothetical protein